MRTFTLTMRIQAEDSIDPEQIREEVYDAGEDVPFSFDITDIAED
ncbi:hypothetical protein [Streptomyces sp. NPDC007083]